jgi:hypothetical protein
MPRKINYFQCVIFVDTCDGVRYSLHKKYNIKICGGTHMGIGLRETPPYPPQNEFRLKTSIHIALTSRANVIPLVAA